MRTVFSRWCREHSYEGAAESLERDWERMVTFYDFPLEHWRHIVESPFCTEAQDRRGQTLQASSGDTLLVAESRFRRLTPDLMRDVYQGAKYDDGIVSTMEKVAASCLHTN